MKKRILSVVCALAIVVGMIIPWTGDVHAAEMTTCKCGVANVEWEKVTENTTFTPGTHYRLERDVQLPLQLDFTKTDEAGTYCFDLAGYTLHTAESKRSFLLGASDGSVSVTVNIMDSSAAQTGRIEGFGTNAGGLIYMYSNCILNVYGGTFINTNSGTDYGGIFNIRKGGVLNMYGGKMVGITVTEKGGVARLWSGATLNVAGGEIVSGISTGNLGDCVYAETGAIIKLSKNAKIGEIYFADAAAAASGLTISGKYTGKAALKFGTEPADGAQIGISDGANIGLENIYILTPRMYGTVSGNTLVATEHSGVAVKSGARTTIYATLAEACASLKAGDTIKLLADNSENVTIPVDATLDLFGWDLTGNVNATGTLTLKDSATDDYTVNDPMGIGVVSGTITGNVQSAANYTAIKGTDGTTYHKYLLKLTNVSLRPREAGVYYKADIRMDEMVQEKLDQFGIAASVYDEEPSLESANTLYTSFGKEDYGTGTAKSALITDFMSTSDTVQNNTANAQTDVYGRPYIQYTDETGTHCLYGTAYGTNLKSVTEQVGNASRDSLKLVQKRALTDMYEAYEDTLKTWDLSYLTTAAANKKAAADDGVLKMLLIGNSHALDSTRMLYEIFQKENPDQEVIIGVMYHSGANMGNHMSYMLDDLAQYEYHKNGDSDTDTNGDGSWWSLGTTTSGVKIERGLNNENWDIVALQEMNNQSATESEFQDDQIELVLDYVNEHLGYEPEIWWNMVWVNPQIPLTEEARQAFPADSSTSTNPDEEQTGSGTDTSGAPALWIFPGGGGPGMKKTWINRYFDNWQNDRDVMFNDIIDNVETYVLETGKQAKAYDVTTVVPVASAVQRAVDQLVNNSTYSSLLGTNEDMVLEDAERITTAYAEQVMYRDYTHMSELGRYITAYVWYAKLMELDSLSTLKCTAMPNYLRKGYEKDTTLETLAFTSTERALARDAINYALANPYATYLEPQS